MLLTNCYSVTKIDKSIRDNFPCVNCGKRSNHAIITLTSKLNLFCLCSNDIRDIASYVGQLDSIPLIFMKRYLLLKKIIITNDMNLILKQK